MGSTIYLPVRFRSMVSCYPNAGPHPNITGMRNLYWGKNAYVVKCGAYAYKVPYSVFVRCK